MSDLTQAQFEIKLKFGKLASGKTMSAVLIHDDCEHALDSGYLKLDLHLPTHLRLKVFGKDMACDTVVDEHGKISQDLHVKITQVSLDKFTMDDSFLNQKINLVTETGAQLTTCYIGFNGHVDFAMDQHTVFQQVMHWRSVA